MAFDTCHQAKYEITIIAPGNLLNGRKFYRETSTKKRKGSYGSFGKSGTVFYFDMTGEIFKTGEELLKSIGIES